MSGKFREQYERAKARNDSLPPHARPVLTGVLLDVIRAARTPPAASQSSDAQR